MSELLNYNKTPLGQCALAFAQALVEGNFNGAHTLLTSTTQTEISAGQLRENYLGMIDYWETKVVDEVEALEILDDWPDKQSEDWGWVYVAINGDGFGEAISIVITKDKKIREIEWGRP